MMPVPPFVTFALLVAAIASGCRVAIAALVAIGLVHVATLAAISLDACFEDDGARAFIGWRYRVIGPGRSPAGWCRPP